MLLSPISKTTKQYAPGATAGGSDVGNLAIGKTAGGAYQIVKVDTDGAIYTTPSGTVAVSLASVPLPSGAATAAKQDTQIASLDLLDDAVGTPGGVLSSKGFGVLGTDGSAARLLKTNSSGELQIGIASAPVLGVTSNGANISTETTLSAINGKITACNTGAVVISSGSVSIGSALPVGSNTIGGVNIASALPAGSNSIGSVSINAAIPAGANTIGGVNIVSAIPSGSNTIGAVNLISGQSGISGGAGTTDAATIRAILANNNGKTIVNAGGSVSSSGDTTLIAAGTNKLKVFAFSLSTISTTAVTCIFKSNGIELWRLVLQAPSGAATGANLAVTPPAFIFATTAATALVLNLSSAQTVHWSAAYFDEA